MEKLYKRDPQKNYGLPKRIFFKVSFLAMSIYFTITYHFKNKFSKKTGVKKNKRKIPVIISLTTFGKRIGTVYLTVESLLNQSIKPDSIQLWLSQEEFEKNQLPKKLLKLESRGLSIKFCERDDRSYKKLVPAIKESPDAIIVTADDDIFYPKWFLEKLLGTSYEFPKDIIANRAHKIKKDDGGFKPYSEWFNYENSLKRSRHLIPTGCSGVLYPPHSLHKDLTNHDKFNKLAPNADDIWFKAMAILNNTKTTKVFHENIILPEIFRRQGDSLFKKNILESENDIQIKNTFEEYALKI